MAAFADRLKEFRAAAGLTQEQLAEKSDMNRVSLARLEGGQYDPSWTVVQKLAKALGVDCMAFQVDGRPTTPRPPAKLRTNTKKAGKAGDTLGNEQPAKKASGRKPPRKNRAGRRQAAGPGE
jgi:DNA-binding XRE family transcriptional regulator